MLLGKSLDQKKVHSQVSKFFDVACEADANVVVFGGPYLLVFTIAFAAIASASEKTSKRLASTHTA